MTPPTNSRRAANMTEAELDQLIAAQLPTMPPDKNKGRKPGQCAATRARVMRRPSTRDRGRGK